LLEHGFAGRTVIGKHTYLDQAVGVEGGVDLLDDVGGQAVAADQDDGIKMVGLSAVNLALGGSQLNLRHVGIISPARRAGCVYFAVRSKPMTQAVQAPCFLKESMKTKTSSKKVNKAWLHDHINDPYVKLATREGYRARAAYKLKEIDETLHLIKPGQLVVDLGCTPGAWSQYLRRRMSPQGAAVGDLNGTIIGLDLLPMEPIEGVTFIQGDFREAEVLQQLEAALAGRQADVVVSDMAPNLSGISSADAARVEYLIELAIEFAQNHMKPQGALVAKVFHGGSYNAVVQRFKDSFTQVKPLKPKASRDRSSETFLVGLGLK
jgi:23S rRNA (uridine2552-2'-O)-methyltransferase